MSTHVLWLFLVTVVVLSRVLVHHPYSATTLGGTVGVMLYCISYVLLFRTCGSCLCSPRAMCAVWKVHYFCSLLMHLLLSGDVHLNPGPDDQPYAFCLKLVTDDDEAICCDCCNQWL